MNTQLVRADNKQQKQNFYTELKTLIEKHRKHIDDVELMDYLIRYSFVIFGKDNSIKTEYQESYCDLYMDYAKNNINPNGFFGKYLIDEGCKDSWMKDNYRFKQTVAIIPNITANLLNENIQHVLQKAAGNSDIKTITMILLRLLDVNFKTDKDSGVLKQRGIENINAKKRAKVDISDADIKDVEEFLEGVTG